MMYGGLSTIDVILSSRPGICLESRTLTQSKERLAKYGLPQGSLPLLVMVSYSPLLTLEILYLGQRAGEHSSRVFFKLIMGIFPKHLLAECLVTCRANLFTLPHSEVGWM